MTIDFLKYQNVRRLPRREVGIESAQEGESYLHPCTKIIRVRCLVEKCLNSYAHRKLYWNYDINYNCPCWTKCILFTFFITVIALIFHSFRGFFLGFSYLSAELHGKSKKIKKKNLFSCHVSIGTSFSVEKFFVNPIPLSSRYAQNE